MNLKILKANNGDALLLSWSFQGVMRNILIDGGTSATYKNLVSKGELYRTLLSIKERDQRIDLLILTHIDDDHIGGVLAGFKHGELLRDLCDKVLFNSGSLCTLNPESPPDITRELTFDFRRTGTDSDNYTSIRQGVSFEKIISELGIWKKEIVKWGQTFSFFGAIFHVLSPTEEKLETLTNKWSKVNSSSFTSAQRTDYDQSFEQLLSDNNFIDETSIYNGSSIAFLVEHEERKMLLLGDAHDRVVVESIKQLKDENGLNYSEDNRLKVDFVKLSHHGSSYNTSPEFLKLIYSNNFIISTNGRIHGLPNKITLARVHREFPTATVWFNYPELIHRVFAKDEISKLGNQGFMIKEINGTFEL